jgi:hypothetical protein
MPRLEHMAAVLRDYSDRFELLDAFADDIEELRSGEIVSQAQVLRGEPHPLLLTNVAGNPLFIEIYPEKGIARFRLTNPLTSNPPSGLTDGAALGGVVGSAIGAASDTKEGLLGGLVLGVLVGGEIGAAATPVGRARTLRFDPSTGEWRLYHGPLLRWAKRNIQPAA